VELLDSPYVITTFGEDEAGELYLAHYTENATGAIYRLVSDTPLVAAVGPSSRSVQVGSTATAFALILNSGTVTALGCSLAPLTSLPITFSYQALHCATNLPLAALNTPVDISAGGGGCFIFTLTPSSPIVPTNLTFNFDCTDTNPAPVTPGVNTFLFSASTTPPLDLVASALTGNQPEDGIVNLPGATGAKFIVLGTINLASIGGTITAEANTGGVSLPVNLSICQWNIATASCLAPFAPSVTSMIGATGSGQDFASFVVLVQGLGNIAFEPGSKRVFISFHEGTTTAGPVRGLTSVAVRTQ
jgi:hypothetical protein